MRPVAIAIVSVFALAASEARAQFVYVTGYAPAPVYVAPPTVVYRPVTPVVAYSPVVAPVAVGTTFVGGPVVTTRYRPILGGAVSRVRYHYAPTTYVTPVW